MIVDDEPLARIGLRQLIEQYTDWKIVLELESGQDLETYVLQLQPSLIFLDIRMPKRNGLLAAAGLKNLKNPPLIVFVSAYSDYALQAFELYALDYLLKPFSDERFTQTINRLNSLVGRKDVIDSIAAQQLVAGQDESYLKVLIVRSIGSIQLIDIKDVVWFKGSGNYVEVMLADSSQLHRVTISYLEENLNPKEFIRCHRSAIVRLTAITEVKILDDGQHRIYLSNGNFTSLSQTYKESVLKFER